MASLRSVSRLALPAARCVAQAAPCAIRVAATPALRAAPAVRAAERLFSSSAARLASKADKDLVSKLKEEYQYEMENSEDAGKVPEFVEEFHKQGTFKVADKTGEKLVKLTRTMGNETISVVFATDSMSESEWEAEEAAEEEDMPSSFVVRCTAHVSKKDAGTLEFALTITDGQFLIDAVNLGSDSSLMLEDTAEADWKRNGLYGGPIFEELDEDLQSLFGKYLEERGFNPELADFIAEYIEYKEQIEYTRWLQGVADFVSK